MISHIVWDVTPEIFDGVEFFRWYGVCWLLGMLMGYQILHSIYKSESIPAGELDYLTTYLLVGIILGARLGHILFYDPIFYWNNPIEILPFKTDPNFEFTGLAGLASHGGILGGLFALFVYNKKYKKGYLWLLDRITIAGAALGGLIRVGNLMNSEMIGIPSDLPWSFVFKKIDSIPRHPAQLYEAIIYLVISIALYLLWRSRKYHAFDGFICGLGLTLIFTHRFLIEFFKENQVSFEESMILNMGQTLSIPLIMGGVCLTIMALKRRSQAVS